MRHDFSWSCRQKQPGWTDQGTKFCHEELSLKAQGRDTTACIPQTHPIWFRPCLPSHRSKIVASPVWNLRCPSPCRRIAHSTLHAVPAALAPALALALALGMLRLLHSHLCYAHIRFHTHPSLPPLHAWSPSQLLVLIHCSCCSLSSNPAAPPTACFSRNCHTVVQLSIIIQPSACPRPTSHRSSSPIYSSQLFYPCLGPLSNLALVYS